MCGLVGGYGQLYGVREKMVVELLAVSTIRGAHSTGIAGITQNSDEIAKEIGPPQHLFWTTEFVNIMKKHNICLMGHNRFATRGEITVENAHPFDSKNIIGTHNGTVHNKKDFEIGTKYNTDSEAIFNHISSGNIKDTWKKLDGAAVLVWWDRRDNTLNLISNDKRSFWFGFTDDNKCCFWASEKWMLQGISLRNSIKLKNIASPKEHCHWKFSLNPQTREIIYDFEKLEYYVPPVYSACFDYGIHGANYNGGRYHNNTNRNKHNDNNKAVDPEFWDKDKVWDGVSNSYVDRKIYLSEKQEVLAQAKTHMIPIKNIKMLSKAEKRAKRRAEKLLKNGTILGFNDEHIKESDFRSRFKICAWCREGLTFGQADLHFLSKNEVCCHSCYELSLPLNSNPSVLLPR